MTPAAIRKQQERQRRKEAGEIRLEFHVPAAKAEAVRAAVAAALDDGEVKQLGASLPETQA
jgi:hypothetical protein